MAVSWFWALLEPGEQVEHGAQVGLDLVALVIGADQQVLLHAHKGKEVAALRRVADAQPDDSRRRQAGDVPAIESDLAAAPGEAHDGIEQGRLAGAVGADDRDDPPRFHLERNAVQRLGATVEDVEIADAQERHGRLPSSYCPR